MFAQQFRLSSRAGSKVEQIEEPATTLEVAWIPPHTPSNSENDQIFSTCLLSEAPAGPGLLSRCNQRGCIFPAAKNGTGRCVVHALEQREPVFFQSLQPSTLLLDHAKFAVGEASSPDSRGRDRRRLAALRAETQEEAA